ncbi:MAG TPA: NlpC/P60 family protein, partial [Saprospiraceae bacterium]|nr:NlpC/P60 family protein [Saprospiraceae bacterium]
IRKNELKEGDLVFFKINGPKVSHVGLYLSDGYFVHATVKKGVMISSLSEPYYEKFYSGSGRVL